MRGVGDLGMELDTVEGLLHVTNRGERTGIGGSEGNECVIETRHLIAMAHPDRGERRDAAQQSFGGTDLESSSSVFPCRSGLDDATEQFAAQLHSVTNAQYRNTQFKQSRIAARRPRLADAGRPTRKDDALGSKRTKGFQRGRGSHQEAECTGLSHSARDELGILAAKIEDQDGFMWGGNGGFLEDDEAEATIQTAQNTL